MALEWREQLSVGNDLIDSDHKYLIELINQATDGLAKRALTELTAVLDNLSKYSKVHFSREEQVAVAVGYPGASQLHESHGDLLKKLEQITAEIGQDWTQASAEHFSAFLRDWLINHVIKEDMLMKPYMKKFSPRFDPR